MWDYEHAFIIAKPRRGSVLKQLLYACFVRSLLPLPGSHIRLRHASNVIDTTSRYDQRVAKFLKFWPGCKSNPEAYRHLEIVSPLGQRRLFPLGESLSLTSIKYLVTDELYFFFFFSVYLFSYGSQEDAW